MKQINIGNSSLTASEIVLGCMRISGMSVSELSRYIDEALEAGITMFDHADIYGKGRCEELFGEVLASRPHLRGRIHIQSKCSIRDGYYDLSKEHILASVDGILKRLQTDYLDMLLLHRPDTLMEPEEVAEAFERLHESGKVRHFGVSNFNSMQIELLQAYVKQPIIANQMQFSIMHANLVTSGIQANTLFDGAMNRDGHILEYCRLKNITLQAWSPFQYGFFEGVFIDNEKFPEVNEVLGRLAEEKGVSKSAIAVAWILRHPANMQVIVGTTNSARLRDICQASHVQLSRQEWYEIYRTAGHRLP
ncbi:MULTISPECIES: aldo/keto reductase [Anoxybacillus]|uniref:Aldo/keto reductase n=2 Tax=Anoxybacillus flavithermus TaxID=33934 RepID=A0A178TJW0_9BACL|nr:aldo/keto reductase [Anoxybacillus flavithermus]ASA96112.1 aldo/keto reductase [Anoxybacillus flavithermus]ELK21745.1 aldo/keto reductase [Anoxybacillus flavithermus TNO-09.006]MBE2905118.1 aldo/keto reductase [Anoxybacillus flavithermus]MBE2907864.1 aldo/keto reductase [Anoxybacillus flavithermus]MBE2910527.1 aldo/keto reductase [Anoxybacillus flavithermus]